MNEIEFPWDDTPEFCQAMLTYERNHPAGPNTTLYRRYIMWNIYKKQQLWVVPEDPFKPEEWIGKK